MEALDQPVTKVSSKFSVLMSVYFREEPSFLWEALLSIVHQSIMPDEIILVIDGEISSELSDVINDFKQKYHGLLKTFPQPINSGLGNALRIGIAHCQYEIIARMDTDDISAPSRFAKQMTFLNTYRHIAVVGTNIEEFNLIPGDLNSYKKMPEYHDEILRYAKYRNPLNHPSIMMRKSAVILAGNYTDDLELFEDYSLFARMLLLGFQFHNIQENLLYFRVGNRLEHIRRRSGLHYARKEFKFLVYIHSIGFISIVVFINSLLMKAFVRLVPTRFVIWFYKKFLRFQSSS